VQKHILHDSHKRYLEERIKELLNAGDEFVGNELELTATIHELMALCPGDHNVVGDIPNDIMYAAARKARPFGIPTPDLPKHRANFHQGAIAMAKQVKRGDPVMGPDGTPIGIVASDSVPNVPAPNVHVVHSRDQRHFYMGRREPQDFHNQTLGVPYEEPPEPTTPMRPDPRMTPTQPVTGVRRDVVTRRDAETEVQGDERYRQQLMDAARAGLVSAQTVMEQFGFDVRNAVREGNEVRSRERETMSRPSQVPGQFVRRREPEAELSVPDTETITRRAREEQRAGRISGGPITPEVLLTVRQLMIMEDLTARIRLEHRPQMQRDMDTALDAAVHMNENGEVTMLPRARQMTPRERQTAAQDRQLRRQADQTMLEAMGVADEVEAPSPWNGNGVRKADASRVKPDERERLLDRVTAKRKRRRIIKLEDEDVG
jgi:hypothetical protein